VGLIRKESSRTLAERERTHRSLHLGEEVVVFTRSYLTRVVANGSVEGNVELTEHFIVEVISTLRVSVNRDTVSVQVQSVVSVTMVVSNTVTSSSAAAIVQASTSCRTAVRSKPGYLIFKNKTNESMSYSRKESASGVDPIC
jgi:hypothetical protein